jgi:4-aminobutyrate aminotransferase-like enzyme
MKILKFVARVFKTTMFDRCNLFSNEQSFTGDGPSTDAVDLGTEPQRSGSGRVAMLSITEAFAGATSGTMVLQSDPDPAFGAPVDSSAIQMDNLAIGEQYTIPFPKDLHRYVRIYLSFDVVPTAGAVTAGIVLDDEAEY